MIRCKLCGQKLSSYNKNKYCFAHMRKGLDIEQGHVDKNWRAVQSEKSKEMYKKKVCNATIRTVTAL